MNQDRELPTRVSIVTLLVAFAIASDSRAAPQALDPSPWALVGTDAQAAGPVPWRADASAEQKFERILEAWGADDGLSGAVLATRGGRTVLARAFGMASRELGVPNTVETRFAAGYLTRPVTAALAGRLIERGQLDLETPVDDYLALGGAAGKPTIRQLLTNRSGLEQNLFRYTEKQAGDPISEEELRRLLARVEALAEPGAAYAFSGPEGSSTDSLLLALAIEATAGRPLAALLREEILEPLAMSDSGLLHPTRVVEGLAQPYQVLFARPEPFPSTDYGYLLGGGDLYSTVGDLERFFRRVVADGARGAGARDGVILSLGAGRLRLEGGAPTIGPIDDTDGTLLLDSNGWMRGGTILVTYFPERGDLLLVLSNFHRAAKIYDLRRRWVRTLFDLPVGAPERGARLELWPLLRAADVEGAERFYRRVATTPGGADLPIRDELMFHIRELRRGGRLAEALSVARLYRALEPEFWLSHWELGEVQRQLGEHDAAAEAYQRSLALEAPAGQERTFMEDFLGTGSNVGSGRSAPPLDPEGRSEFPRWSPDGSRIAFVSTRHGNLEIYTMAADGSDVVRLTHNPYVDAFPSWSPDGNRLAFSSTATGAGGSYSNPAMSAIFVIGASGGDRTRLTNLRVGDYGPVPLYNDSYPVYSPDGARIAFLSDRDNGWREIFVMNADGTDVRRLTYHGFHHWNLLWTPDGSRIAFDGRLDGFAAPAGNPLWGIHSINASGPTDAWGDDVQILVNDPEGVVEWDAVIAPDGRTIGYHAAYRDAARRDGRAGMRFAPLEPRGGLLLPASEGEVRSQHDEYWADWSPDGTRIAFTSTRAGHAEIYVMDADGTNVRRLTFSRSS